MEFVPRKLAEPILLALRSNPVVYVNGPRQAGKGTLERAFTGKRFPADSCKQRGKPGRLALRLSSWTPRESPGTRTH